MIFVRRLGETPDLGRNIPHMDVMDGRMLAASLPLSGSASYATMEILQAVRTGLIGIPDLPDDRDPSATEVLAGGGQLSVRQLS